jgi:signal transduction histidine kinase/AmiR/NasT family two-component response regulator
VHLNIRSKLVLWTVLPVVGVYALLFWLGIPQVKNHFSDDAQRLLVEHAQHQASRLALTLSQVPALAESLGDLALAEPATSQTLWYAHLIDGLRRTPIAEAAAVLFEKPPRGALMRRGSPMGEEVPAAMAAEHPPGWQIAGDMLHFHRPIRKDGVRIGASWVELAIANVYDEIERLRSPVVDLYLSDGDGVLLRTGGASPQSDAVKSMIPAVMPDRQVVSIKSPGSGASYWMVGVALPDFPWRITAVMPTATALQPARRAASLVAAGLLLSLLAIVTIIGMATRRISRPLASLDATVRKITQGDFSVAPEVASDDELGALARAIRRMTLHIQDREQQLRHSHQALEQRVSERTSELQKSNAQLIRQIEETRKTQEALRRAKEQAQQANRAKTEFLSNMSHELRTPLHGVLGYAQILRRDSSISPEQRESLEAIERCGQHLLTLINDILDLTKIEAGQMPLDFQSADLPGLLEDVRTIVAQRAAHKGLELQVELVTGLPQAIRTDPVRLKQILLNLLGNAVKFTESGVVTLSVNANEQGMLQFEVGDTGVGIPSEKIGAIFDAFHQAREGQAVDGTGLGLAINQRLIGLLGGEALKVESSPGVGSRFSFRIPFEVVREEAPDRARHSLPHSIGQRCLAPGDTCNVMVVDELAENRRLVSTLLRDANCAVETFADKAPALQRLRERPFDLVLLDVPQPSADATQTLSAFRRAAASSATKLVAVSANVLPNAHRLTTEVGFDAFLAKPFGDRQLLDLLQRLLGIRFEAKPAMGETRAEASRPDWPGTLAGDTATRIGEAIAVGDVGSLFQLAEELAGNPKAPDADVDNLALMARMFDFEGLRRLAERLRDSACDQRPA